MTENDQTWIVQAPSGGIRFVGPRERSAAAETEITKGWRDVAEFSGLDGVVAWALEVGVRHGWPLDPDWVRDTFKVLIASISADPA